MPHDLDIGAAPRRLAIGNSNAHEPRYIFAVLSDSHNRGMNYDYGVNAETHSSTTGILQNAMAAIKKYSPAFVVHVGDATGVQTSDDGDGTAAALGNFKTVMDSFSIPYYTTVGNHEHYENWNNVMSYNDVFPNAQNYYVDYGADRLVFGDNSRDFSGAPGSSGTWLDNDVVAAALTGGQAKRHQFVFTHVPIPDPNAPFPGDSGSWIYIAGHYNADNGAASQVLMDNVEAVGNVAAIFHGHIHAFHRYQNRGIPAFICAGGGGILFGGTGLTDAYHWLLVEVGTEISVRYMATVAS